MAEYHRLALLASPTEPAQAAARDLADTHPWVPFEDADAAVVLGGDGFMLQTLHQMIDGERIVPVFGMNLGTVGFLMNKRKNSRPLAERIHRARRIDVAPLMTDAVTRSGECHHLCAINEVSLLRETRQTAKLEVTVNGKVRVPELACDGVLVATPAGSTAYNLSANGPILPLGSALLALTPISPFRPRRWRGAIVPDNSRISFRVLEPDKRPVSAVADQRELREIAEIGVAVSRQHRLTLLFDRGHSLDERIVTEQFQV